MIKKYSELRKASDPDDFPEDPEGEQIVEVTVPYKEDAEIQEFNVEVTVTTTVDPNYGADADGNRGISMEFVEDWSYNKDEVGIVMKDGSHQYLSDIEDDLKKKDILKYLDENVEKYLEKAI